MCPVLIAKKQLKTNVGVDSVHKNPWGGLVPRCSAASGVEMKIRTRNPTSGTNQWDLDFNQFGLEDSVWLFLHWKTVSILYDHWVWYQLDSLLSLNIIVLWFEVQRVSNIVPHHAAGTPRSSTTSGSPEVRGTTNLWKRSRKQLLPQRRRPRQRPSVEPNRSPKLLWV